MEIIGTARRDGRVFFLGVARKIYVERKPARKIEKLAHFRDERETGRASARKAANASISFYGPLTDRKTAGDRLHGCNVPIKAHSRKVPRKSRNPQRSLYGVPRSASPGGFSEPSASALHSAVFVFNAIFMKNFYNRQEYARSSALRWEKRASAQLETEEARRLNRALMFLSRPPV
jgi:hypothetical protein